MTRTVLSTLFLLVVLAATPALVRAQPASAPSSRLAAVRQIAADLREAREQLGAIANKQTRERLELLLTRAELKALDLQKELSGPAAAVPRASTAVSPDSFAAILKGLKAETFDSEKLTFLESFGRTRTFTCAQLRELLKEFSFDDCRGKAALALHSQLSDADDFFQLADVFTFATNFRAVRDKVKPK